MVLLLANLGSWIALGGLFWLSGIGLGCRLEPGAVRRAPVLVPELLGLAIWIAVLFLLAAVQILRPLPILLLALVLAGWGAASLRRFRSRVGSLAPELATGEASPGDRAAAWTLALAGVAVVAVLLLETLHPGISWDASAYHLTLPKLYLEHGGFFRVPFNVYSNWPLGVELLFALAMVVGDYVVAKTVHFGFALATLAVVYRLAARRTAPWVGLLAGALVLFNPVVLFEASIAYVDLALAFFAVAALLFLDAFLDDEEASVRRTHLLLCGLCCGLAAATKLNGFFVATSLAVVLLVSRRRAFGRAVLRELPLLLLPTALGLLPWLVKSAVLVGNPVYPLLYPLLGGPEWSAELARRHAAWQRSIGMGRGFVDYLLLPVRVILFGDRGYARFDGALNRAWIVLLPAAAAAVPTSALARRALGAGGLLFLLWSATSQQMRLLIPALPLFAVAAAHGTFELSRRLKPPNLTAAARSTLAAAVGGLLLLSAWPYLQRAPRLALTLAGHGPELRRAVVPPVARFVNETLPDDARLLLLNTNQGFFFERPYLADSFFEASQVAALFAGTEGADAAAAALRELGVTHVLLDRRARGIAYPATVDRLLQDRLLVVPIYESPDSRFVVFELRREETG